MHALLILSRAIDRFTATIGRWVKWLILAAVLVSAANATSRKLFDLSSNAWLELQWYLFGAVYMLAAAYALQRNDHIRIDIVSNALSKRVRNWIDAVGHAVMLLPFCYVMVRESVPFLITSIRQGEMSANAGGLIIWPAKAMIVAGFVLLLIQAVSELIKRVAVIRGLIPDPYDGVDSHDTLVE